MKIKENISEFKKIKDQERKNKKINHRNKNSLEAFKNANNGFKYLLIREKNFRFQIVILLLTFLFIYFFKLSTLESIIIVGSALLIIIFEIINSLIEMLVDLFSQGSYNLKIKIIKDVSASMVLLTFMIYLIILIFILFK